MLSDGNQTNGNTLERFLTPYQRSRLLLKGCSISPFSDNGAIEHILNVTVLFKTIPIMVSALTTLGTSPIRNFFFLTV